MTFNDDFCGIMVLESLGFEVLLHYMHIEEMYEFFQSSMLEYVNDSTVLTFRKLIQ